MFSNDLHIDLNKVEDQLLELHFLMEEDTRLRTFHGHRHHYPSHPSACRTVDWVTLLDMRIKVKQNHKIWMFPNASPAVRASAAIL